MKRFVIHSLVVGFVVAGLAVNANEAAPAVPEAPAAPVEKAAKVERAKMPPAVDITVSGTLKKEEKTKVGKDGKETKRVHYMLVQDDGAKIMLPSKKNQNLDAFVDKKVTIVGKGREVVDKKGAKKNIVSDITTIEEAVAAAVEAPVAK